MIGRRVATFAGIERPGDYFGPTTAYTNGIPAVFFLKPNARPELDEPAAPPSRAANPRARSIQHVVSPPHTFRECPDGSLEIRASISNLVAGDTTGQSDDGWHGWLDEGHVWRQA
jgi:hypothetical protein